MSSKKMNKLPETVLLCAIEYRVQEHEGLISFVESGGICGVHCQFTFVRDACRCWYLSISHTFGSVFVEHVIRAYEMVKEVYGGNFGLK